MLPVTAGRGILRLCNGARLIHRSAAASGSPFENLKKLSDSESDQLLKRLAGVAGEANVSLAEAVRSQHGQDEGPDFGKMPDIVVYPQTTEEVSEVCYILFEN